MLTSIFTLLGLMMTSMLFNAIGLNFIKNKDTRSAVEIAVHGIYIGLAMALLIITVLNH